MKKKNDITITNAFKKCLDRSNCKLKNIWVDKCSDFFNRSMKSWLEKIIYKCIQRIIAERTVKNKIYKFMTSISKNVYTYKLDGIVNKYIIKMKPVNVKSSKYINCSKEINENESILKIGDIVRISKCKNIFAKGYVSNWSEEVFVITQVKSTIPWTYVISDLQGKDIVGTFH